MNLRVIRVAKWCLISVFMLIILGFVAGVGLFVYYAKDAPKLEESKLQSKPSSVIYDKDGQVLVDLGIEKRELADTKDIPLVYFAKFLHEVIRPGDISYFPARGMEGFTKRKYSQAS